MYLARCLRRYWDILSLPFCFWTHWILLPWMSLRFPEQCYLGTGYIRGTQNTGACTGRLQSAGERIAGCSLNLQYEQMPVFDTINKTAMREFPRRFPLEVERYAQRSIKTGRYISSNICGITPMRSILPPYCVSKLIQSTSCGYRFSICKTTTRYALFHSSPRTHMVLGIVF